MFKTENFGDSRNIKWGFKAFQGYSSVIKRSLSRLGFKKRRKSGIFSWVDDLVARPIMFPLIDFCPYKEKQLSTMLRGRMSRTNNQQAYCLIFDPVDLKLIAI